MLGESMSSNKMPGKTKNVYKGTRMLYCLKFPVILGK